MIVEEYKDTNTHFKKSKLENGLTVVTEHCAHARSVNAAVYINKGTRDEPKHLGGAAHFIEHMVFKGSKKFSALDIVKNLEAVGGDINAYTTREYTCIHANALKENLNLSLDILMDMATNAIFDPSEFEKEKQVVF